MELEIDMRRSPPGVRLIEPDVLRSFAVVVLETSAPAERSWPDEVVRHEEHVWVRIDRLRDLAGRAAGEAWETGFGGMIDFARSRGWVDDELGAVRAHVERRPDGG